MQPSATKTTDVVRAATRTRTSKFWDQVSFAEQECCMYQAGVVKLRICRTVACDEGAFQNVSYKNFAYAWLFYTLKVTMKRIFADMLTAHKSNLSAPLNIQVLPQLML